MSFWSSPRSWCRNFALTSLFLMLIGVTGCGAEAKKENEALKQQVESLEMEKSRLKKDLEQKDKQLQSLRDQMKEAEVTLITSRLGVTDPSIHLYAIMKTSLGDVTFDLHWKEAPRTVANFVELAEGKRAWKDPKTQQQVTRPFYDGLIFHRIIPDFMIQGGDPNGDGTGGPGYDFDDEFTPSMVFDRTGLLAMANRGPNTNGSQFFITTSTPRHLDQKHTIFGEVVKGMDVVTTMSKVKTGAQDRPETPVVINSLQIVRAAQVP